VFRFASLLQTIRILLVAVAVAMLAQVVHAQQQAPMVGIEPIRNALTDIENAARRGGLSVRALTDLGEKLNPLRDQLRAKLADLEPQLAEADTRMKAIGPPPAKDAPPEDSQIAAERAKLTEARNEIDAAVKQVQLLQARADRLATTLSERRRATYAERLFRRTPNVLDPFFWRDAALAVPDEAGRIVAFVQSWTAFVQQHGGPARLVSVALVLIGLAVVVAVLLRWWRRAAPIERVEARFGKAIAALLVFARHAAPGPAVAALILLLFDQFDLMTPEVERFGGAVVTAVWTAVFARAAGMSVLSPAAPQRRLLGFDDSTAAWLERHLTWAGRLLGALVVLRTLHRVINGPQPIIDALQILFALAIGVLLVHLLIGRRETEEQHAHHIPGVRLLAWIVAAAIGAALLTGYAGFASFIASRLVFTLALVAALYLLLVVTDAVIERTLSADARRGRAIAAQIGIDPRRLDLLGSIVSGVARVVFVLVVLALAVGRWEIAAADFVDAIRNAAFGIRIGDISISVGAILGAIALFIVILVLTRVVQRWLERDVLPKTAIDPSLRLSISTMFGYLGFIVAFVIGLAELGIDLQKIALVAGALSVGIGFGLQSIVSNFVSGLILLAERPIRVGDQIAVKGDEGFVRRISVRSTEIETFDRANVIIPNSDLITGVVKNWTHTNTLGRVLIKVGVSYDSDPDLVRTILTECASQHAQVLKVPAPAVLLAEFGDNALNFEVYCIVSDLGSRGSIKSDIQFTILKRFRAAGIEIPYPQHDVRIRQGGGAPEPETKPA
jgi:small-conductance mechanosensitive channel